jgi:hypothetical protein
LRSAFRLSTNEEALPRTPSVRSSSSTGDFYRVFLCKALTGDFGNSFRTGRPVLDEIAPRYLSTVALALLVAAVSPRDGVGR